MQRALWLIIAGVALAGCQSPGPDTAAAEEPIAGVHTRTGPVVDLGEVETVDGGRVDLSAFANEAGGICLDADDGQVPSCSPSAAPDTGVELDAWLGGDGRACVYGFASTDVTEVVIEEWDSRRELAEAELLPSSAELGLHIFTGCYDDPSLAEPRLRAVADGG